VFKPKLEDAVGILLCGNVFRLRDESTLVRKNTVLVLTHLILNDMIKVKGQISELATCVIDSNSQIAELCKVFFSDLAKRVSNVLCFVRQRVT
jgi:hypothetical protein